MKKNIKKTPPPPKKKPLKKKKRGRTFSRILTVLILLAAITFVFYRGWIQSEIPENHSAIIFSKPTGYDKRVYHAGEFIWKWEAVIPQFVHIHLFPTAPQRLRMDLEAQLPSAKEYSKLSEIGEDFTYKMSINMEYTFLEEHLLSEVTSGRLSGENLSDYQKSLEDMIRSFTLEYILKEIHIDKDFTEASQKLEKRLSSGIERRFPSVKISQMLITFKSFPDGALYNRAREVYFTNLEIKTAAREAFLSQNVINTEIYERKLVQLNEYGKILSEYPILIQFLALESDSEFTDLVGEMFKNQ